MINPLHDEMINDNISLERMEALLERVKNDMKRKEILSRHASPIKKLPNGRWYTRIDGKKIERKELKELEDLIINRYKDDDVTINSLFDDYLSRRKDTVSENTWKKDIIFRHAYFEGSVLESIPINKVTLDDGYDFVRHCLNKSPSMKQKYWRNIHGCLRSIMRFAIDEHYILQDPLKNLRPRRDLFGPSAITRDGDKVFSKSEQQSVCNEAFLDAEKMGCSTSLSIPLTFNLGLRIGELCTIKWGDIDHTCSEKRIHIQRMMVFNIRDDGSYDGFVVLSHCKTPKGNRYLTLNSKSLHILKLIKEINRANGISTEQNDYIFHKKDGGPCTPNAISSRLRRFCKNAGMSTQKSIHDIRRTVLTNLYKARMPLQKIQEFAGHSTLRQTMDYLKVSDDHEDVLQYLEAL